ncbi:MFS transporter [Thermodesulfobacteriota bacterium]
MMTDRQSSEATASKQGFYYGYIIVLAAFLILAVVYGARFAFGVFFKPMATEFGWGSAETSLAFSISMLLEGLLGVAMGHLTDRLGPRIVLTAGGILVGLGLLMMSQVSTVGQFYLIYGLLIGIGMGSFFVPLIVTTGRWFDRRRSTMTGVVMAGTGIGTLIIAPVANWIIYNLSWQASYFILGGVILVVVTVTAQFLKRDPSKIGILSYDSKENNALKITRGHSFTLKQAAHTLQFWSIIVISLCFGFCVFSANVHLVPAALNRGISAASSANILAITGGIRVLGNIMMGKVADRIGKKRNSVVGFVFMFVALLWLLPAAGSWAFYLFAILFGFGYGAAASSYAPLVGEYFGLKYHGLIFGISGLAHTFGGAFGPYLTGHLFDVAQSYQFAFLVNAGIAFIGLAILSGLRPPKRLLV